MRFAHLLLAILLCPACVGAQQTAQAQSKTISIGFEATASFWWTVLEQAENGLIQAGSGDVADAQTSGFSFRHGRVGFSLATPRQNLELRVRLRLEERTDIVDFYGGWSPLEQLRLYVGQMKIPSTAEVLAPYDQLDFASRSTFGQRIGDYSLTRTPYISSLMAAKSHNRDLGLALRGSWNARPGRGLAWFVFVGNGMGANRYIGGWENEEFLFTNSIGELYYGGRIEATPVRFLTLGAHASRNHHNDVALGERGPVFDIGRNAWTVDLRASLPEGPRAYGFYGKGDMDDFFDSQRYLFDYSGWGAQAVYPLGETGIELGARFDRFTSESGRDGNETVQDNWTAGVNLLPGQNVRLQLNYIGKYTKNAYDPDLDDDVLFLNFQFFFDSDISR